MSEYYFRAEVVLDNKTILGTKYSDFTKCINQLNHYLNLYSNNIKFIGVVKRNCSDDKEISFGK